MDKIRVIRGVVCKYYGITEADMCSRNRKREYVTARQMAIYLHSCFEHEVTDDTMWRLVERDRTSFYHAVRTVGNLMQTDEKVKRDVSILKNAVTSSRNDGQKFIIDVSKDTVKVFKNGVLMTDEEADRFKPVFNRWLTEAATMY